MPKPGPRTTTRYGQQCKATAVRLTYLQRLSRMDIVTRIVAWV